jgi:hypothetical protein
MYYFILLYIRSTLYYLLLIHILISNEFREILELVVGSVEQDARILFNNNF